MAKDIVRRLRDPDPNWKEDDIPDLLEDAATEIECLRKILDAYADKNKRVLPESLRFKADPDNAGLPDWREEVGR